MSNYVKIKIMFYDANFKFKVVAKEKQCNNNLMGAPHYVIIKKQIWNGWK